jgi:hypothetical protein
MIVYKKSGVCGKNGVAVSIALLQISVNPQKRLFVQRNSFHGF